MARPKASAKGQRRAKGGPVDWPATLGRFLRSDGSLRDFGAAEGLTWSLLSARAARERWVEKREAYRADIAARTTARAADSRVRAESEIDADAHKFALALMAKTAAMLDTVDDPVGVKALGQAHREAWAQARLAAHLSEVPGPEVAADATTGDVTIVRRRPDGTETEVTYRENPPLRRDADADAASVPGGPEQPDPGADRGTG